jgi:hypothetical protein
VCLRVSLNDDLVAAAREFTGISDTSELVTLVLRAMGPAQDHVTRNPVPAATKPDPGPEET